MNTFGICLLFVFMLSFGQAQAEWVRLKDKSVVKVRGKQGDQVAITRSDGTKEIISRHEIDGWLQAVTAGRIVKDVMAKIGAPDHHAFVREKLNQIGMAAVPQLLNELRSADINSRRGAMAALQIVWSTEAKKPVAALLNDKDEYIRQMAVRLVARHFPPQEQLKILGSLTNANDPQISGPALALTLEKQPDVKTMSAAMKNRGHWHFLHRLLPRYQAEIFNPIARRILRDGSAEEKASAVIALVYQMDSSESARALVVRQLPDPSARLRDLAAEYLRWHGTISEIPYLQKQLEKEKDVYTKASIIAAGNAIRNRAKVFHETSNMDQHPWPEDLKEAYSAGLERLNAKPTLASQQAVLRLLTRQPYEPIYRYVEKWKLRPDTTRQTRLDLISRAFGYPSKQKRSKRKRDAFNRGASLANTPGAKVLMPPLRDYFDSKRESFGRLIPSGDNPFSNSYHVGDDVAFGRQQLTVVAIGDGLVRKAETGAHSWGGIVIIEHHTPDGMVFCSLYGHLGPLIEVHAGEVVKKGTKLGTLGRDYVFANGGYLTHLHFGIHRGPYQPKGQSRWISGYLSPDRFEKPNGWYDPQKFLRDRLSKTSGTE